MRLLILAGAALVLVPCLLIAFFFLMKRKKKSGVDGPTALPDGSSAAGLAESEDGNHQPAQLDIAAQAKLTEVPTKKTELLLTQVRETIRNDNSSSVNVLKTWLNEARTGGG
jgi:flagellar biosynthesis/type III secretory pathway M-ring protein FliF/YscJ